MRERQVGIPIRVHYGRPFSDCQADSETGCSQIRDGEADDGSWVAKVPTISGCYALMATREEALAELGHVFDLIADEYQERGAPLGEAFHL